MGIDIYSRVTEMNFAKYPYGCNKNTENLIEEAVLNHEQVFQVSRHRRLQGYLNILLLI